VPSAGSAGGRGRSGAAGHQWRGGAERRGRGRSGARRGTSGAAGPSAGGAGGRGRSGAPSPHQAAGTGHQVFSRATCHQAGRSSVATLFPSHLSLSRPSNPLVAKPEAVGGKKSASSVSERGFLPRITIDRHVKLSFLLVFAATLRFWNTDEADFLPPTASGLATSSDLGYRVIDIYSKSHY